MCEGGNRKNRGRTGKGKTEIDKEKECGGERGQRSFYAEKFLHI